ncbi:hypothetical protein EV586_102584 [Tumebacillus sp. BK434]|uniref:DUF6220 domain-containing protein n=1 Tax=Tumebacillus sp. BK434 TaxID=2512169 RepID=UPI001051E5C8|nr:DUF6220 domain-containing protein [Tumebacillus sp. BK434]TCP58133.1 hypothetical protein EV586_102584 [Tumebacillus sp. BK434]
MSNLSVNRSENEVGDHAVETTQLSPFVVRTRLVFQAMVMIFAICIMVQVFFAGLALFWNPAQWATHKGFASMLFIVSILILVLSFIARLPLALRMRSAALCGILILIVVSAKLPSGIGYVSALHPVLALMLFFGSVSLMRKTNALQKNNESQRR